MAFEVLIMIHYINNPEADVIFVLEITSQLSHVAINLRGIKNKCVPFKAF